MSTSEESSKEPSGRRNTAPMAPVMKDEKKKKRSLTLSSSGRQAKTSPNSSPSTRKLTLSDASKDKKEKDKKDKEKEKEKGKDKEKEKAKEKEKEKAKEKTKEKGKGKGKEKDPATTSPASSPATPALNGSSAVPVPPPIEVPSSLNEEQTKALIRIQKVVRGWLIRKRLPGKTWAQLKARNQSFLDLVELERNHVELLNEVVKIYILPVKDMMMRGRVVAEIDYYAIFLNYETVASAHQEFYNLLAAEKEKLPLLGDIGVIFSEKIQILKPVVSFTLGHKGSINALMAVAEPVSYTHLTLPTILRV
eukprot:TRINITY_DN534_c0_g3_i1.p1 TRINITY_DN534_c0_g3~~TRINITY_DN534_c0_g3_i1.p1  ORF type:complete len:307 (+),score=113.40 TRINITY_DN534_c0_g3_i1:118-1038(+)